MEIVKFNQTIADLQALAESTKHIVSVDVTNEKELEGFKAKQKILQQARTAIEHDGLAFREDAKNFSKNVIKVEKELLSFVTPEEERLKQILDDAQHAELMKVREGMTGWRMKQMVDAKLPPEQIPNNDQLLLMDAEQFSAYLQDCVNINNANELTRLRNVVSEADKEKAEEKRKKDIADAVEADRIAVAEREKAEIEKLAKESLYKEFLVTFGVTPENRAEFKEERVGTTVVLWKRLAVFKPS